MTRRTAIIPIPKGLEKRWLTPRPGSLAAEILARDAANMAVKDDIWYNQLVEDAKKDALGIKQWITTETDVRIPVFLRRNKRSRDKTIFSTARRGRTEVVKV